MNSVVAREKGKSENSHDRARLGRDTEGREIICRARGLLEQLIKESKK